MCTAEIIGPSDRQQGQNAADAEAEQAGGNVSLSVDDIRTIASVPAARNPPISASG